MACSVLPTPCPPAATVAFLVVGPEDTLVVSAVVRNTGALTGDEVVQLYVRDLVGSTTRPVRELKGFRRITLQPGEEQTVRFEVPVRELGHWGLDMRYAVEPGAFKVWIGPDSTRGLEGEFLIGVRGQGSGVRGQVREQTLTPDP